MRRSRRMILRSVDSFLVLVLELEGLRFLSGVIRGPSLEKELDFLEIWGIFGVILLSWAAFMWGFISFIEDFNLLARFVASLLKNSMTALNIDLS